MIYRSVELAPQLRREYDMMCNYNLIEHDYDTSLHILSHPVTCNSVTYNITYNTDLWNGDHHVMSLLLRYLLLF